MKKAATILSCILLLGAAALLALPVLRGPQSWQELRRRSEQASAGEAALAEAGDSLAVFTSLDSLTFANIHQDE